MLNSVFLEILMSGSKSKRLKNVKVKIQSMENTLNNGKNQKEKFPNKHKLTK